LGSNPWLDDVGTVPNTVTVLVQMAKVDGPSFEPACHEAIVIF